MVDKISYKSLFLFLVIILAWSLCGQSLLKTAVPVLPESAPILSLPSSVAYYTYEDTVLHFYSNKPFVMYLDDVKFSGNEIGATLNGVYTYGIDYSVKLGDSAYKRVKVQISEGSAKMYTTTGVAYFYLIPLVVVNLHFIVTSLLVIFGVYSFLIRRLVVSYKRGKLGVMNKAYVR